LGVLVGLVMYGLSPKFTNQRIAQRLFIMIENESEIRHCCLSC
jgi:hypothetical protein